MFPPGSADFSQSQGRERAPLRLPAETKTVRLISAGFTLIELLITVIILAILAGAALPSFSRAAERTRVKNVQSTLSSIFEAERMYRLDQSTYGTLADLTNHGRNHDEH